MKTRSCTRLIASLLIAALAPIFGAGCGGSLPSASEPDQAKTLLVSALDAWKSGQPVSAMATSKPPVRVLDREWGDGFILNEYELQGPPYPLGLNVQQSVTLNLKTPKGKAIKKTINYTVTTGDMPVIARQDIDE